MNVSLRVAIEMFNAAALLMGGGEGEGREGEGEDGVDVCPDLKMRPRIQTLRLSFTD